MRVTPAAAVIALLVASNAVTAFVAFNRTEEIRADNIQRIAVDGNGDGLVRIQLGASAVPFGPDIIDSQPVADIALAPRAVLQLHRELGRMLMSFQTAVEAEHEESRSVDPTL